MSVYQPKKGTVWLYDFRFKGRRFHGTTGQRTKRAAEAVERKIRQDAAEGRLSDGAQLTLDEACGKYWIEHAQHRGDAVDTERRIARLLKLIPPDMKLAEIDTSVVSTAMQKRRLQTFRKSDAPGARGYFVSNGTVNRDVIETLRPILRRARIHWAAKGLPEIAWGELKLSVPRETVKTYSPEEERRWMDEAGPTGALALRLMLTYGMRFGELFFPISAFDPQGPRLSWMKGRKLDVPHVIPLLEHDAREIAARASRALSAGLDTIWYVEEVRDGDEENDREVVLRPLTYYGLHTRLRNAAARAQVTPGRVIHGARHHAGTRVMRSTGNAKVVQKLLGHLDAKSTDRYIHMMEADVRAALEGEHSRNSPETPKRRKRKA